MGPCEESPTPHSPALLSYPFTNGIVHKSLQVVFSVHTAVIASFLPVNCSFFGAFNLFSDSVNDRKNLGVAKRTRQDGSALTSALRCSRKQLIVYTLFFSGRAELFHSCCALFFPVVPFHPAASLQNMSALL